MIRPLYVLFAMALSLSTALASEESYELGAGDKVRVTIFDEPDLSGEFELDGGGAFSLPLLGPVDAMNLSPRALEARLERSSETMETYKICLILSRGTNRRYLTNPNTKHGAFVSYGPMNAFRGISVRRFCTIMSMTAQ